jgi:hypothetical protein
LRLTNYLTNYEGLYVDDMEDATDASTVAFAGAESS